MFWTLLKLKLHAFFHGKTKKKTSVGVKILIGLLVAYVIVIFIGMFVGMFFGMAGLLAGTDDEWLYFGIVAAVMFLLGFITTVYGTQTQVFEAKDNELLLSMPIKPSTIIATRLGAIVVTDLVEDIVIGVIAFVVFANFTDVTALNAAVFILEIIFLIMITTAAAVLVGWLLAIITSKVKNKAVVGTFFSLIFFGAYFVFVNKSEDIFTLVAENIDSVADVIKSNVAPMVWFGKAVTELQVAPILSFALMGIVPFAVEIWLISKSFNKITTSRTKLKYKEYKADTGKTKSVAVTFSNKELKRFTSSSAYMINGGIGLIMMLIFGVVLVVQKETINDVLNTYEEFEMLYGIIGVFAIFAISMLNTLNQISAPSISLEAKNLWLLKSLPMKPRDIMMGKIYAHIKICMPFSILASLAVNYVFDLSIFMRIAVIIVPMSAVVFAAFVGLIMNLVFPKFEWNSEAEAIKQGISVLLSMGICFAVFITVGIACFIVGVIPGLNAVASVLMLLAFGIPSCCMYRYICNSGTKRFNKL